MVTPTIPRLPDKRQKPYSRPAKTMTIGIGFLCQMNVVMGSDRQMTLTGWHKHSEKKLFYDVSDERIIAVIGGDDLGLAKEFWWKLLEYPIVDAESLEQGIASVLDGMGRLTNDLPLQLLCGIATKTGTYMLGFRGKGIYPIMDDLGIICAGDSSLIRYLSKHIDLFWESTGSGVAAAVYLLKRAEEFVDGCKGPMDLIILEPGPRMRVIDPALIEELDERLSGNHDKAFRDLLLLSPPFST